MADATALAAGPEAKVGTERLAFQLIGVVPPCLPGLIRETYARLEIRAVEPPAIRARGAKLEPTVVQHKIRLAFGWRQRRAEADGVNVHESKLHVAERMFDQKIARMRIRMRHAGIVELRQELAQGAGHLPPDGCLLG